MTYRTRFAPRFAVISLGIALLLTGAVILADETIVKLEGYVEAVDYDDDGNVVSVSIYDSEWGSVLIAKEGKGAELTRHVDADVEITGKIVELDDDSGFAYAINVSSFKLAGPDPE